MNKKSHNKKRNVGIIYEQLLQYAAQGLVEGNNDRARKARRIIRKYFKQGTELYKEHRLFKALVEPHIPDGSLATKILTEAKRASRAHSTEKLNREKSKLIKEINYTFGQNFYSQRIQNYTDFATVQTLLNDWRSYGNADIARVNLYESKVHTILTKEKVEITLEEHKDSDVNNLVVRLMTEKFNKKYKSQLNEVQQELIKQYVFSQNGDSTGFKNTLDKIRKSTIRNLGLYEYKCDNEHVAKKIHEVKDDIANLDINNLDDHTMSRFLTLCKLSEELRREDHE